MTDPRRESLAAILIDYSVRPHEGETLLIECFDLTDTALPSNLIRNAAARGKLRRILESDVGASYVSVWSIGCNPKVLHPMRDILFDDRIAGSFHLTPGTPTTRQTTVIAPKPTGTSSL
jgi:leucyl aminopeptidase (aminopeptidase T)